MFILVTAIFQAKSPAHRMAIDKVGDVVRLEDGQNVKIDAALRAESLILSDAFDCDEFEALELVITGTFKRLFIILYIL